MKRTELRIGNFVNTLDGILKVDGIGEYVLIEKYAYSFSDIKPIPLTEEILLKCGFVYTDEENEYMSLIVGFNSKLISSDKSANFNSVWLHKEIPYTLMEFKYLHQLQNLYFTLTNQELQINL